MLHLERVQHSANLNTWDTEQLAGGCTTRVGQLSAVS